MTTTDLEPLLAAAYRREASCYERALAIARGLKACAPVRQSQEEPMQQLLETLKEVAVIEEEIRAAKEEWQTSARRPGAELQSALTQVAGVIEQLRTCVAAVEERTRAEMDRLAPQLDQLARSRQMQAAYRGSMAHIGPWHQVSRGLS